MAAGDLTTLANLKQYANVSGNGDDALLTRMITAFSAFAVGVMNRNILTATYTDTLDGVGGTRLQLHNYPVTAVASLTLNGTPVPAAPSVLSPGYQFSTHSIMVLGYEFSKGYRNVVVAYTAGYAAVPADIEEAVLETIAIRYKERDRIGYVSKSLAGETVTFFTKDMPDSAKNVFQNYRRVAPLT